MSTCSRPTCSDLSWTSRARTKTYRTISHKASLSEVFWNWQMDTYISAGAGLRWVRLGTCSDVSFSKGSCAFKVKRCFMFPKFPSFLLFTLKCTAEVPQPLPVSTHCHDRLFLQPKTTDWQMMVAVCHAVWFMHLQMRVQHQLDVSFFKVSHTDKILSTTWLC